MVWHSARVVSESPGRAADFAECAVRTLQAEFPEYGGKHVPAAPHAAYRLEEIRSDTVSALREESRVEDHADDLQDEQDVAASRKLDLVAKLTFEDRRASGDIGRVHAGGG